jgi:hypothetical protein
LLLICFAIYEEHLYMNDDGLWQRLCRLQKHWAFSVLVFLDISVKLLLKQPLHNHTHLFIKAHTKSRAFFNIQAGGKTPPPPVDSPFKFQNFSGGVCPHTCGHCYPRLISNDKLWLIFFYFLCVFSFFYFKYKYS